MKLQIYHSVNAGLVLWNGKSGILIDFLHKGYKKGFSDTPERYVKMMETGEYFFGQTNDILLTHAHPDHYDENLIDRYLTLHPDSYIYGPGVGKSNRIPEVLEAGVKRLKFREYEIYAFRTVHDGSLYAEVPHESYLIKSGDQKIWISGDCLLNARLAEQVNLITGGEPLDAIFVMTYQLSNHGGRDFITRVPAKHRFLYHRPYREDDRAHLLEMTDYLIRQRAKEGVIIEAIEHDSFVKY